MTIDNIIQVCIAAITCLGIVVSLCSSNKQLKVSNKQTLFDKRIKVFLIAKTFERTLAENESILKIPTKIDFENSVYFYDMINNVELNHLSEVMPKPLDLDGPSSIDLPEAQRNFLTKKEELLQIAQSAEFIFKNPENKIISTFLTDYILLLDGRRRYDILLKQIRGHLKNSDLTVKEYGESINEPKYRKNLLTDPIDKLSKSFKNYQQNQKKIRKQISLVG